MLQCPPLQTWACPYVSLCLSTWDWWLGPLPGPLDRARAETGGAVQWVIKWREFPGFARVFQRATPASCGYPLSVFNKNSTLMSHQDDVWITTNNLFDSTTTNFDEMPCKLDSTEFARSFQIKPNPVSRTRMWHTKSPNPSSPHSLRRVSIQTLASRLRQHSKKQNHMILPNTNLYLPPL